MVVGSVLSRLFWGGVLHPPIVQIHPPISVSEAATTPTVHTYVRTYIVQQYIGM